MNVAISRDTDNNQKLCWRFSVNRQWFRKCWKREIVILMQSMYVMKSSWRQEHTLELSGTVHSATEVIHGNPEKADYFTMKSANGITMYNLKRSKIRHVLSASGSHHNTEMLKNPMISNNNDCHHKKEWNDWKRNRHNIPSNGETRNNWYQEHCRSVQAWQRWNKIGSAQARKQADEI